MNARRARSASANWLDGCVAIKAGSRGSKAASGMIALFGALFGQEGMMRRPLRHALSILRAAGIEVDHVRQAGKHTEIILENGNRYRLPHGNHPSRRFERGLRSYIRKFFRGDAL